MRINSDLVIFPHFSRTPPALEAVVRMVDYLIAEGMVSVSRPFTVRVGHHRWSQIGGSPISGVRESSARDAAQLSDILAENRLPMERNQDLRIAFRASSWLFYESVLRRLSILWDEVWPPQVFVDLVPETALLWDRLRAGWEVTCPDCAQLLYHSRDGVQVGWFKQAPWFPCYQVLASGRCPDPDSLVQCFRCGKDYAFKELKVRVPRNSCSEDVPQTMPLYRLSIRVGGGGTWIGVGYKPDEQVDAPVLRQLEGILGRPLRHFDDWY